MELELNLERTLAIWWSFCWRAVVAGTLGGVFLGFLVGVILGFSGKSELSAAAGALAGWLLALPVSIWALKAALTKKRSGFRLVILKNEIS